MSGLEAYDFRFTLTSGFIWLLDQVDNWMSLCLLLRSWMFISVTGSLDQFWENALLIRQLCPIFCPGAQLCSHGCVVRFHGRAGFEHDHANPLKSVFLPNTTFHLIDVLARACCLLTRACSARARPSPG